MCEPIVFSVILPVCHGGTFLKKAIRSLREIDFSPDTFEVIVVGSAVNSELAKFVSTGAR